MRAAAARHPGLIKVVVDDTLPKNKPKAMNLALQHATRRHRRRVRRRGRGLPAPAHPRRLAVPGDRRRRRAGRRAADELPVELVVAPQRPRVLLLVPLAPALPRRVEVHPARRQHRLRDEGAPGLVERLGRALPRRGLRARRPAVRRRREGRRRLQPRGRHPRGDPADLRLAAQAAHAVEPGLPAGARQGGVEEAADLPAALLRPLHADDAVHPGGHRSAHPAERPDDPVRQGADGDRPHVVHPGGADAHAARRRDRRARRVRPALQARRSGSATTCGSFSAWCRTRCSSPPRRSGPSSATPRARTAGRRRSTPASTAREQPEVVGFASDLDGSGAASSAGAGSRRSVLRGCSVVRSCVRRHHHGRRPDDRQHHRHHGHPDPRWSNQAPIRHRRVVPPARGAA